MTRKVMYIYIIISMKTFKKSVWSNCKYFFHFIDLVEQNDGDSLDNFMNTMSHGIDKNTTIKIKRRIVELKKVKLLIDNTSSL